MELLEKGHVRAVMAGSSLTFLLFLLQRTVPVIGFIAGIVIPLPCIYVTLQTSRKAGLAVISLLLVGLSLLGPEESVLYLVQSVTISLALPEFLKRGDGLDKALLYTVAINVVVYIVFFAVYGLVLNGDSDIQVRETIHTAVAQVEEVYRTSGVTGDDVETLVSTLQQTEKVLGVIYPALLLIFCWLTAACNVVLVRKLLRLRGKDTIHGSFSGFRNPDYLVWVLIAAGFAHLAPTEYLPRITLNVLIAVLFLYFVQGMAIVAHLRRKYSLSRFMFAVFIVLMVIQPVVMVPVAAIGLFDLWADFRAPKQQENL